MFQKPEWRSSHYQKTENLIIPWSPEQDLIQDLLLWCSGGAQMPYLGRQVPHTPVPGVGGKSLSYGEDAPLVESQVSGRTKVIWTVGQSLKWQMLWGGRFKPEGIYRSTALVLQADKDDFLFVVEWWRRRLLSFNQLQLFLTKTLTFSKRWRSVGFDLSSRRLLTWRLFEASSKSQVCRHWSPFLEWIMDSKSTILEESGVDWEEIKGFSRVQKCD